MPDQPKPQVVLCILDGVGWRPDSDVGNAVALAKPAWWPTLFTRYPHTTLHCSGLDVGLPVGQMGNSEVGHLTIGSGRIIDQEINRVSRALASGEFGRLPAWTGFLARIKASGGGLHLLGLVSPGGVHSHTDHLYGIIEEAARADVGEIFVHAFLDGRDTDPHGGLGYIRELEAQLARIGAGRIASVSGRYYAMDRDQRWDRVEKAWRALVHGEGVAASDAAAAVEASYAAGVTDEFVAADRDLRRRRSSPGHGRRRRRRLLLEFPRRPRPRTDLGVQPGRLRRLRAPATARRRLALFDMSTTSRCRCRCCSRRTRRATSWPTSSRRTA